MSKAREALEKRAQKAILQHAIFRPESAILIALTLILAFFMPLVLPVIPAWVWLLGGLIAEGVLVYSSLTDADANRQVVAQMLEEEFQPAQVKDERLQQEVQEAFEYRRRVAEAIRERGDTVLRDELLETASQFDDWLEEIFNLVRRLDRYYRDRALHQRNRQRALERKGELEKQLAKEDNPRVRQEIQANLGAIQRQLDTIEQLENAMERAALRLESTVLAMSTIYTQVTLMDAKDIDSGRSQRLRQDIAEEVTGLSDVLVAMDDVYRQGDENLLLYEESQNDARRGQVS